MKKILSIMVCSLLIISACKGNNPPTTQNESMSSGQQMVPRPENEVIELTVKNMYDDIGKAIADTSDGIPDFNGKYGSEDWKKTVSAVEEHDSKIDGIGFFEADPWIMGQDAGDFYASDIEVGDVDSKGTPVTLQLHNFGSITKVRVVVVEENEGWKVDNLIDLTHNFDWKKEMKQYLSSHP